MSIRNQLAELIPCDDLCQRLAVGIVLGMPLLVVVQAIARLVWRGL